MTFYTGISVFHTVILKDYQQIRPFSGIPIKQAITANPRHYGHILSMEQSHKYEKRRKVWKTKRKDKNVRIYWFPPNSFFPSSGSWLPISIYRPRPSPPITRAVSNYMSSDRNYESFSNDGWLYLFITAETITTYNKSSFEFYAFWQELWTFIPYAGWLPIFI